MSGSERPTPWAAFGYALRLGCLSFGGPAAQIALISHEVIEVRRWLNAAAFSRALSLAMLLPGPEALQVVIYLGWRLFGALGAILAGLAFLLPGALLLAGLSFAYMQLGSMPGIAAALVGLKAIVIALVLVALITLARRILRTPLNWMIAASSFVLGLTCSLPTPMLLAGGAFTALLFADAEPMESAETAVSVSFGRILGISAVGGCCWLLPWLALRIFVPGSIGEVMYLSLSRVAIGGFGGAYAMVAWTGDLFVQTYHWIGFEDVSAGIGLSEATPGPLLLALQFYGFVAGWGAPQYGSPATTAILCSILALVASFLPSFVSVIALAPAVETIAHRPKLLRALGGVSAVVIGIIATFALNLAHAVLVQNSVPHIAPCVIAVLGFVLLLTRRIGLAGALISGIVAGVIFC
jgi:chromate transporter